MVFYSLWIESKFSCSFLSHHIPVKQGSKQINLLIRNSNNLIIKSRRLKSKCVQLIDCIEIVDFRNACVSKWMQLLAFVWKLSLEKFAKSF
jgi:hypothetical protein